MGMTSTERQALSPRAATSAAQGSVALIASFVMIAVLNYAFAITMSWLLPVARYGVLGVIQTLLLLGATLVSAGFPWALTSALSRAPESAANAGAFRAALIGNVVIGGALGLGLYNAGRVGWLPFGAEYEPLLLLTGMTVAVLSITAVFAASLQGFLRFKALGTVRAIEVAIKFLLGTALVWLGVGVAGAVVGFLVGAACSTALAIFLLRDFHFLRGTGWGDRRIYAGVGPLFLGMVSLTALVNADIIGLKLAGPADVSDLLTGHYQAAVTLARIPIFLTLALFNAVFPYIAQHANRSDLADAYAALALKYTLLFIVPIDVAFIAIPADVIGFFYPAAYGASAGPLVLAACGTIALTLTHALAMLLQAAQRPRLPALVLPFAVALELVALAVLVPRLGTNGAPLAVLFAGSIGFLLLLPSAMRAFHLRFYPTRILSYLVALGAFGLLLRLLPHASRVGLIAVVVLASVAYGALLVVLGLVTRHDIEKLGGGLGPRFGGATSQLGWLVERCNFIRP